jgi:hypothetical protein
MVHDQGILTKTGSGQTKRDTMGVDTLPRISLNTKALPAGESNRVEVRSRDAPQTVRIGHRPPSNADNRLGVLVATLAPAIGSNEGVVTRELVAVADELLPREAAGKAAGS